MLSARAWKFDRGAWSEIQEDIFTQVARKQAEDVADALGRAGYGSKPVTKLGSVDHYGFAAELYTAAVGGKTPEYPYYVMVSLGPDIECIYITDFPSLALFLSQIGAIVSGLG